MARPDRARIAGTMYGQAIGDSLGLPAEWKSAGAVAILYGREDRPQDYIETERRANRHHWKAGEWSDDTEMALAVVDAYLEGLELGRGPFDPISVWLVAENFLDWAARDGRGMGKLTRSVFDHPDFAERPHAVAMDAWILSGESAAPNGAVMRSAYVGLLHPDDLEWTQDNAWDVARTTHWDPRCVAGAVAVAVAVACLVCGAEPHEAIGEAIRRASPIDPDVGRWCGMTLRELDLDEGLEDPYYVGKPPVGFTHKCLGAAFWALRQIAQGSDLPLQVRTLAVLRDIIRQGGDTDTNAAVAGALMGAAVGVGGLPAHLVAGLHQRSRLDDRLMALARLRRRLG